MEQATIEAILAKAQHAADTGAPLAPTGFWKVVSALKRSPDMSARYADKAASIDQLAFRNWALLVVPLWVGTMAIILGTAAGAGMIGWAYYVDGFPQIALFLLGTGVLLTTTHGLAHLVVGSIVGIKFTAWFVGTLQMPQPGVKTDYASYLRTPARSRAWMHASGAIATKLTPFALVGAAMAAGLGWIAWLLIAVGVGMIVTDVVWSTKSSDWKKFRREMRFAQPF